MTELDRDPIEVPTLRTDTRMQWVLLAVLVPDLLLNGSRFPVPVRAGIWALTAALVVAAVWAYRRTSRQRPPVRATSAGLRLPDADGKPVEIDWGDIAGFTFTRRQLLPHLLVTPTDPGRLRPAPNAWQIAAATRGDGYRIRVALGGDRATRDRLRAELSSRVR